MTITDPDIMIEMIKNGEGVEHYEEWAHCENLPNLGHITVKWELAKHGYFPEYFLNSNAPGVATYALKAHPEYLPELIESTKSEHIHAVHNILIDKQDPTEDELLTHIYILNDQMQNDSQDYSGFSQIDSRAEMRMKIAAEKQH